MGDCHLGGWRQPELARLTMESFAFAISKSIENKVDFVLIAGDLFDTAYPPIEVIKQAFEQFRKLKEARIPVFLIAGSHDYSAAGKTFLDVLEKAGFAKNVFQPEERNDSIILHPTLFENVAIYGYPGKKSGLEVDEIARIKLHDAPGFFKILMLHTTLRDAVGNLPIPTVDHTKLPKVDYLALAHLHINYKKDNMVYCGPTFPNNSSELEELKGGSFYFVDTSGTLERVPINLKEVVTLKMEIKETMKATEQILEKINEHELKDKVVILKLHGIIYYGKKSDINLNSIEEHVRLKGAYAFLKSTTKLFSKEGEISFEAAPENLEDEIIKKFQEENRSRFNSKILTLLTALNTEKKEGEISKVYDERIFEEARRSLEV